MADSTTSTGADPPKNTDPPKGEVPSNSKSNDSSPSKSTGGKTITDHYVELLLKLQHTAAVQLQEEQQNNIKQHRANWDQIVHLENTLFDNVTKAEEEKQERLTPPPKSPRLDLQKFRIADGPFQSIEPFLNWVQQLQIYFSTKSVINNDNKIYVAGGLLEETILVRFYASEGALYAGKTWKEFRSRLFEVALPQRWRTTLKSRLRELTMGPTESFIVFSSRAQTLQSLINFDDSLLPENVVTHLSDFDLAKFVVLGVKNEIIHRDITKFALLDATPFSYSAFKNCVACFNKVTV
ncbi:hypothetical protein PSTG_14139 [Puccinia striiformis f. sp. tritici PST-78]|uniref:Retrotransposon gag domain-containing protein n=1 Tax=Puccinia striiformis f. sp. tritici PST-78 TaxID=1165861 RepID=A0A0L0UZM7_9BASI|nr:hypothetical protein PSTG_14139 [Puccinia striiformis f. sp. tritici PST-78]